MSAIAGIINIDGSPIDRAVLARMAEVSKHRGPDGIYQWSEGSVGLIFAQLATTPESLRENQPSVSADRRYVIVWDGRIDNRSELIAQLGGHDSISADSTDPEILLSAFSRWRRDCLDKLVGDFAFAIWDSKARSLFCGRDPVGVRVVHYFCNDRVFVFGTEIKQLLSHPAVPETLDLETLGLFLCGITRWGDRTFYQRIKRLPGGHRLELVDGVVNTCEFWNPNPWDQIKYSDLGEYYDHFNEIFRRAVSARLRSARPIAILLSGGLDSSAVAAVASRSATPEGAPDLHGYHWTFSGSPADDKPSVETVASAFDINLEYIDIGDLWAMKQVCRTSTLDEPFIFQFESMHRRSNELLRNSGHRVLLTGEGGDETCAPGHMLYLRDWVLKGKFFSIWKEFRQGDRDYRIAGLRNLRHNLLGPAVSFLRRTRSIGPEWLSNEFTERFDLYNAVKHEEGRTYRDNNYVQHRGYPPVFVGYDQLTAEYEIEPRHPFWDSRIVEFFARIPPAVRFQGSWDKPFMKMAVAGIVPPAITIRPPQGSFGGLRTTGLKDKEASRLGRLLVDSHLEFLGVVQGDLLRSAFESYLAGDAAKWSRLFGALVAEEWLDSKASSFRRGIMTYNAGRSGVATNRVAPGS